jgi:phosphate transport system substrate-binding protein
VLWGLVAVLILAACGNGDPPGTPAPSVSSTPTTTLALHGPEECATGSIVALGSTALEPLVEAAAQAYMARCPDAEINIQGGGSGTGLAQVLQGGADIADSDIFAEQFDGVDPARLTDTPVAIEAFAVVTHPDIAVASLTQAQLIAIFTGKVTNWRAVGGPDTPIALISRPFSSGTRITFRTQALGGQEEAPGLGLPCDSSGALARAISDTPGAIGYLSLAYDRQHPGLHQIAFNGVAPNVTNITAGAYPIWSYGHLYTRGEPHGLTAAFLTYLRGTEIQDVLVPQLGYIPISRMHVTR